MAAAAQAQGECGAHDDGLVPLVVPLHLLDVHVVQLLRSDLVAGEFLEIYRLVGRDLEQLLVQHERPSCGRTDSGLENAGCEARRALGAAFGQARTFVGKGLAEQFVDPVMPGLLDVADVDRRVPIEASKDLAGLLRVAEALRRLALEEVDDRQPVRAANLPASEARLRASTRAEPRERWRRTIRL